MTSPHNKRRKAGWQQGKAHKANKYRHLDKEEIKMELETSQDDYKTPARKRKRNLKASLEYRIKQYETMLERKRIEKSRNPFDDYLRSALDSAKAEYQKKYGGSK